ncbi:unnamed protein product [Linum tenue]|uniref:Uncharacterized protein n=1 Tax=Linum tenue TaxID=586396 RepID=A0AAV0JCL9_9ROSI|nr:unnamed protein product [Linum tenue]
MASMSFTSCLSFSCTDFSHRDSTSSFLSISIASWLSFSSTDLSHRVSTSLLLSTSFLMTTTSFSFASSSLLFSSTVSFSLFFNSCPTSTNVAPLLKSHLVQIVDVLIGGLTPYLAHPK